MTPRKWAPSINLGKNLSNIQKWEGESKRFLRGRQGDWVRAFGLEHIPEGVAKMKGDSPSGHNLYVFFRGESSETRENGAPGWTRTSSPQLRSQWSRVFTLFDLD